MFEKVLFTMAAVATIAAAIATVSGFVLDVWREWKSRADDGGKK